MLKLSRIGSGMNSFQMCSKITITCITLVAMTTERKEKDISSEFTRARA
jgi:hypothetical protein